MKKTFKQYTILWAILLVAYNIIVFAVRPIAGFVRLYDARFWISWGCVVLAFLIQLLLARKAFQSENKERFFLNIPLITESYAALIVMIVAASVLMLIPDCPAWIAVIVCTVICAFSGLAVVKAEIAADVVSDLDKKIKSNTLFIKSLTMDAERLMAKAKSTEVKVECKKVFEAVRYSDPMSHDTLSGIESQLSIQFAKLSEAVASDSADLVVAITADFLALSAERNNMCKLLK